MVFLPKRNKPMSVHAFNLIQTKILYIYLFLIFLVIAFSGASTKYGATVSYVYFRW